MEKSVATKTRNKFLKLLPKAAAAAVSFQNPPFSPGRDKRPENYSAKLKAHVGKGYSGPLIPMIPPEARRKSKNSSFETQEPSSPKVSCMGQIKNKHMQKKKKQKKMTTKSHNRNVSLPKDFKHYSSVPNLDVTKTKNPEVVIKPTSSSPPFDQLKKKPSSIQKIFGSAKPAGRKSDASADHKRSSVAERAPTLSQMRKFASSRDTFSNFDWTKAQIAPEENDHHENYFCNSDEEENEVIIPFSAPILVGEVGGCVSLEARKEINLWKRRTMAQPTPLRLNT